MTSVVVLAVSHRDNAKSLRCLTADLDILLDSNTEALAPEALLMRINEINTHFWLILIADAEVSQLLRLLANTAGLLFALIRHFLIFAAGCCCGES